MYVDIICDVDSSWRFLQLKFTCCYCSKLSIQQDFAVSAETFLLYVYRDHESVNLTAKTSMEDFFWIFKALLIYGLTILHQISPLEYLCRRFLLYCILVRITAHGTVMTCKQCLICTLALKIFTTEIYMFLLFTVKHTASFRRFNRKFYYYMFFLPWKCSFMRKFINILQKVKLLFLLK